MSTYTWHAIVIAVVVGAPFVYIIGYWKPCICTYLREGECCPRHGAKA